MIAFKHFHAGAIAIALAEHGEKRAEPNTRARVSEAKHIGPSAHARWLCLRRWTLAAAAGKLFSSLPRVALPQSTRQLAASIAWALRGRGGLQLEEPTTFALWRGAMIA